MVHLFWTLVLSAPCTIFASTIPQHSLTDASTTVKTESGEVVGQVLDQVKNWKGIPFAKSPPERFSPPEPATPWTTTLQTTKGKPSCMEQFEYPELSRNKLLHIWSSPMPEEESEDCLYLNIWAPTKPAPAEGWPVMFWIYGGNLRWGHALRPQYDGKNMAQQENVVVVSINYRTNVFGFPGSPYIASGKNNLGFLDQRFALGWVNRNIAKFGGDPKRVLIFGESAGGFSVKQLIANPPSHPPPFSAALMQSQASGVRNGREAWKNLAADLKCTNTSAEQEFKCIKAVPASKIKSIIENGRHSFGPLEDGVTFVKDVQKSIKAIPASSRVPVILGTNADDGSAFVAIGFATPNTTLADMFSGYVGDTLEEGIMLSDALLIAAGPLYPKETYATNQAWASAMFTDTGFQCNARALSRVLLDSGWDVRRYFFTARYPEEYPFPEAGAYHMSEILQTFATYNSSATKHDRLSKSMMGAWTSLAKDPKKMISDWPQMTKEKHSVRVFDIEGEKTVVAGDLDLRCETIGELIETQGV